MLIWLRKNTNIVKHTLAELKKMFVKRAIIRSRKHEVVVASTVKFQNHGDSVSFVFDAVIINVDDFSVREGDWKEIKHGESYSKWKKFRVVFASLDHALRRKKGKYGGYLRVIERISHTNLYEMQQMHGIISRGQKNLWIFKKTRKSRKKLF